MAMNVLTGGHIESVGDVPAHVKRLRSAFQSGDTLGETWRRNQLKQLLAMLCENEEAIVDVVSLDLGKHPQETRPSAINLVKLELDDALKNLRKWMTADQVYTPLACQPASSFVYKQPKGVSLIIAPWNYPCNLALAPFIGAIAAGNPTVLKLSRHSQNTGKLLAELVRKYLDMRYFAVEHKGGAAMITELLKEKYDHIFFTGSVSVGKVVARAAAENLTTVTLELGGKNPCIVDRTSDVELAARRIAWGKWFNAGQTCIGVDYILVEKEMYEPLIEALKKTVKEFYGDDPKMSNSFGRVISSYHAERLSEAMKDGDVVFGGEFNIAEKYVSPTIITNPKLDSKLMQDEIFGPLLPIIAIEDVSEALAFIRDRPISLALYFFSSDEEAQERVLTTTRSGAALVNEVLLHFTNSHLPFGGCGESGIGAYHGELTFNEFTHRKAVVKSTSKSYLDMPVRYPPYEGGLSSWMVNQFTSSHW